MTNETRYAQFYENVNREDLYVSDDYDQVLGDFVRRFSIDQARLLEVGSGRGQFQHISNHYTGIDIAENLRSYYRPPAEYFVISDGKPFPFPDNHFDAAMTFATFEHIPSLENAFRELLRVVRPGGHILFHAAWQVRPWAARGLAVRPFRELSLFDRLEKLTVPLRESLLWRSLHIFPKRLWRSLRFTLSTRRDDWRMDYRPLKANYEQYWQTDGDACNQMDIHAAIVWFLAHGCKVEGYATPWAAMKARTGSFIVEVAKPGNAG
jgi:SAM-dependent methyltransferase